MNDLPSKENLQKIVPESESSFDDVLKMEKMVYHVVPFYLTYFSYLFPINCETFVVIILYKL